ncbi:MAG TPA: NAD(P)/FAD-dependent oxidoreductase [Thermoleophilaceae bacterium]|nr:NAD(P)/FAD-dependent oxidoreductase [Thermoleophilaceae bacterium]
MSDRPDVVVIGAGQAGLSVSFELSARGVPHVVLERGRVGETWRGRWESFCLVTPNWSCRLPGHPYEGPEPDGYMPRDEIVAYLEDYAARSGAPLRDGVEVTSLEAAPGGGFALGTSEGELAARVVVVASGAYQRPHRPAGAATLPAGLVQLDVPDYRAPGDLPEGRVLVVGSGQSGAQIAEELHGAGREVFLACGRAPWLPRRIGDHDLFWWTLETGFMDQPVSALPSPRDRLVANVLASGRDGGHDLHLRTLHRMGVILLGHFLGAEGHTARFAPDLADSIAWGDARRQQLVELCRRLVAERGLPDPGLEDPEPFEPPAPEELDLRAFGSVLFAGGFRPGYGSWMRIPGALDELGFPLHHECASTAADGLLFAGVHFLRTRKSSLLVGVGEDAAVVARQALARLSGRTD